jgi:hypothetical protein
MLGGSKVWDYRFISNGGIIERERTRKKPVARNAMGECRVSIAEHYRHNDEPNHAHIRPLACRWGN